MRVAVLASGGGSNLQALIEACRGRAPAQIAVVISNKADAGALDRARAAGIPIEVLANPSDGPALNALLQRYSVGLVVLAGYLKLIPPGTVAAFDGRIINIHPALLPSFGGPGMYGHRVHEAVLNAGASVTGVTVHLVNREYDRGSIVAQWPVPVQANDTPDTLAARVLTVEHRLLPAVVLAAARAGHVVALHPGPDGFASPLGVASLQPAPVVRQRV